jgi:hypothetical protein
MISFQRLLGREAEFCRLLEASAQQGCEAVAALKRVLSNPRETPLLHEFAGARSRDAEITERISEMLFHTFVTPMEREDIETLAEALYKIPKTIEKFAQRYLLVREHVGDVDFSSQMNLMEQAVRLVLRMVQALRAGRDLGGIKTLQARLQAVESEADNVLLVMMMQFYAPGFSVMKAIMLRDLVNLNEKAVDRCRDAGNVISRVILKNA